MIELLVVIGITIIILSASIPIYNNFQITAQVNENSAQITQTIRSAKNRADAGYNNSNHGVKFFVDRYILYQGENYDSRETENDKEIILDGPIIITTTLNSNEIIFTKRTGKPSETGTINLTHEVQGSKTITINSLGLIKESD